MKKVNQRRKLQLSPEIIRSLRTEEELHRVPGGSFSTVCTQSNNSCNEVQTCKAN